MGFTLMFSKNSSVHAKDRKKDRLFDVNICPKKVPFPHSEWNRKHPRNCQFVY